MTFTQAITWCLVHAATHALNAQPMRIRIAAAADDRFEGRRSEFRVHFARWAMQIEQQLIDEDAYAE